MKICAAHTSHPGLTRARNEDRLVARDDLRLYAVLDGMGGAPAGDVAAERARDGLVAGVASSIGDAEVRIRRGVGAASAAVAQEVLRDPRKRGMGTTVVALLAEPSGRAVVAHVGDSRAYLLRAGTLRLLTHDHCLGQQMLDAGSHVPRRHPAWNVLTRNLASPAAEPELSWVQLAPGDRVLLCSDGLHGYASEASLGVVLGQDTTPRLVASTLVELALAAGGGDNVTVVVMDIRSGS